MSEIRLHCLLPHPPALVWRALTDRTALRDWAMDGEFDPTAGACFLLHPRGLDGLEGPVDVEIIDVDPERRLTMLWQDGALHSRVVWRLQPADAGTLLTVTQTGFLGPNGSERRRALTATYKSMFEEKLPATLDRLAVVEATDGSVPRQRTPLHLYPTAPGRSGRRRSASALEPLPHGLPPEVELPPRRSRVLLAAGALVLLLVASVVIGAWIAHPSDPEPDGATVSDYREPGTAMQPGGLGGSEIAGTAVGATLSPVASSLPVPTSVVSSSPVLATASWRPAAKELLSWSVEVTIHNPGTRPVQDWTVLMQFAGLDLLVTDVVGAVVQSNGAEHTFTPVPSTRSVPAGGSVVFTYKITPAPSGLDRCTIDGRPCS